MLYKSSILRNIISTAIIAAMIITSFNMSAFADDQIDESGNRTEVSLISVDGNVIESEIVYYIDETGTVVSDDNIEFTNQVDSMGNVYDASGTLVPALLDAEGNTIKQLTDGDGAVTSPLFDSEGIITDDNGGTIEYDKAYFVDQNNELVNNNVYIVTEDGMVIASIMEFFVDEYRNIVDIEGNVIVEAAATESGVAIDETAEATEEASDTAEAIEESEATEAIEDAEAEEPVQEAANSDEATSDDSTTAEEETAESETGIVMENDIDEPIVVKAMATSTVGWKTKNGYKYYYYTSTSYYKSSFVEIDGVTYAFDDQGHLVVNSFIEDDEKHLYAAGSTGAIQKGIFTLGDKYYYANPETYEVRTTVGFFTYNNAKYYVTTGNNLACNKKFTVNDKKYIAGSNAKIQKGAFKYGKYYYFAFPKSGILKTSKGWAEYNGKKYYVNKYGHLYTSTFKTIGDATYYFKSKGSVASGVFKAADGHYYYAIPKNNHIKHTAGFVTYSGNRYYVNKGGKLYANTRFSTEKYTYIALANATLAKGVFLWNGNYYYATSKCHLRTKSGLFKHDGKTYCIIDGSDGKLYRNKIVKIDGNKYFFSSTANARTGTFTINGIQYKANDEGVITSMTYLKLKGIDVSYAQGSINWTKVKAAGIDFAIIRCGYTGSTTGRPQQDDWFMTNIKNAKAAGLKVGVYYFTVALTEAEAKEEAEFTLSLVKKAGITLDMPIVIDSEGLGGSLGRTTRGKKYNALTQSQRTKCVKAFCETIKSNGYTPMIYASTSWLENKLDMSKLSSYKIWVAQYYTKVTYEGSYNCWQYTSSGKVNGINTSVDMNWYYGNTQNK